MRPAGARPCATARLACAVVLALALAVAVLATAPVSGWGPDQALAKSYTCPRVDTTAQAQTDGSLHIVEQRTFDFDGAFTAVWWTFEGLPSNAEVHINSLRMAPVDAEGNVTGEWIPLQEVTFQLAWREAGGPGIDAWSFDEIQDTVYAFFDQEDAVMIFELDYVVVNGVQAYEDVAEIYWKYVPEGWAVDSRDVSVTIALPLPADAVVDVPSNEAGSWAEGQDPTAGTGDVRAWGHGPLDGVVSVNADGTVSYEVPLVRSGQYAEARVVFPVEWLTNLSADAQRAHQGVLRLGDVLAQESAWADQANAQRAWSLVFNVGIVVVCVVLLAAGLLLFWRFGREYKPDFTGEYWRDVPEPGMQPAVVGRLWRWNHESVNDLTATIMHLAQVGALRIDRGSYVGPKGELVDDYYLTINYAVADQRTDPVEVATLSLLFRRIAQGQPSLWLGSIKQYGHQHPEDFTSALRAWQDTLSAQTAQYDFFEKTSSRLSKAVLVVAIVAAFAGVVLFAATENLIPLVLLVPTAIALGVIANYLPRRSRFGNDVVARCKALRNWLRDFSRLDERPPTDVKVWGSFMVYAYLFGIAEKVMEELRDVVPQVVAVPEGAPGSYVPWYVWYSAGQGSAGAPMPSVSDLMQTSVSNAYASAQAALSAASGGSSSGFGGGGGFSGGGGGGFGGGGGAR
ncbi:MAG: DUF2207 domain-containing protein [Eggerthellaceae bacterium]|nr:DUF2207 domain-containing protein [Eggerthellaceae bacterium]